MNNPFFATSNNEKNIDFKKVYHPTENRLLAVINLNYDSGVKSPNFFNVLSKCTKNHESKHLKLSQGSFFILIFC